MAVQVHHRNAARCAAETSRPGVFKVKKRQRIAFPRMLFIVSVLKSQTLKERGIECSLGCCGSLQAVLVACDVVARKNGFILQGRCPMRRPFFALHGLRTATRAALAVDERCCADTETVSLLCRRTQ